PHFATGWGAFQRKAPTGGAAKGMPLKRCTFESLLKVPSTSPASARMIPEPAARGATIAVAPPNRSLHTASVLPGTSLFGFPKLSERPMVGLGAPGSCAITYIGRIHAERKKSIPLKEI